MSDKKLADLNKLALLAKVPAPARQQFFQEVRFAIKGAKQLHEMNWSRPASRDISKLLKCIAADAQILAAKIDAIRQKSRKWYKKHEKDFGRMEKEYFAGIAFAAELHDKKLSIRDVLVQLETISGSAADAAKQATRRGRPRGTTERLAFDAFATALYDAARQAGGNLTIYKSAKKWSGSFLDAFSILELHLPDKSRFSPGGDLGRVLLRIADQFRR